VLGCVYICNGLNGRHVCLLPCAGALDETGTGAGAGYTLNVPLPPGSGGGAYRAAFDRVVGPALDAFQPQLILVSAGEAAACCMFASASHILSALCCIDISDLALCLSAVHPQACA
jgi:hypothetical protein